MSSGMHPSRCPLPIDGVHFSDPVSHMCTLLMLGAPSSTTLFHHASLVYGDCRSTPTPFATFTGDCRSISTPLATFTDSASAYDTIDDASHICLPSAFAAGLSMASSPPSTSAD